MQEYWKTSDSLIQRAQDQSDESAWDEFVDHYRKFIWTVVAKSGVNTHDIEDLVQDVLVKIWKGLPNYEYERGRAKFRTWLTIIIRNAIRNHVQKHRHRDERQFEYDEHRVADFTSDALEQRIEKEWRLHLADLAMANVKKKYSGNAIEVFLLSGKGMSASEVAEQLDLAVESVYVLRMRVKQSLQQEIKVLRRRIEYN